MRPRLGGRSPAETCPQTPPANTAPPSFTWSCPAPRSSAFRGDCEAILGGIVQSSFRCQRFNLLPSHPRPCSAWEGWPRCFSTRRRRRRTGRRETGARLRCLFEISTAPRAPRGWITPNISPRGAEAGQGRPRTATGAHGASSGREHLQTVSQAGNKNADISDVTGRTEWQFGAQTGDNWKYTIRAACHQETYRPIRAFRMKRQHCAQVCARLTD